MIYHTRHPPPATRYGIAEQRHCPDCLAPYHDHVLKRRELLFCSRCGKVLKKYHASGSLERSLALVTASLVFLLMANISPIMVFNVSGNKQSNLIITGVVSLFYQGYWPIALLVFISAIALPALHLFSFWYLLGSCFFKQPWPGITTTIKFVNALTPWNLIPVFAVATMAAVVKLDQLGSIEWKSGACWLACLGFSSLLAMHSFNSEGVKKLLEKRSNHG
ncbi:MAG: paraquat-inducible protein A [Chthoniobacterales bacterium]